MNTINLIIGIALLACILTPAYVLYFLKYQLFANQKRHKATIDTISNDLSKLHYEVEKIQFDEVENRLEKNKQILEIKDELVSSDYKHSMAKNTIEDMKVRFDYLRRTSNDDISKVNERVDLTNATYVQLINNLEQKLVKSYENEWEIQRNFNSVIASKYEKMFKQLDSLESLNEITQQILNRINSKEFAQEVLYAWMNTIKQEKVSEQNDVEPPKEVKKKVSKQVEKLKEEFSSISLPYYYKNRINSFIQNKLAKKNKEEVVNEEETNTTDVEKEARKRTPKKDSKRKITMREIETAFKLKTGLTYFGYATKYGQKAFIKKKANIYDSVYYQKFKKKLKPIKKEEVIIEDEDVMFD